MLFKYVSHGQGVQRFPQTSNLLSSKRLLCSASRKRAFPHTKLQKIVHITKHYLNIFSLQSKKTEREKSTLAMRVKNLVPRVKKEKVNYRQ